MKKLIILLVLFTLVGCSVNNHKNTGGDLYQPRIERPQDPSDTEKEENSERTVGVGSSGQGISPKIITENDMKLGNIKTYMTEAQVLKAMAGKPLKTDKNEIGITYHFKDGTEIVFANGGVYSVKVTDPKYLTPRGLKVGDDQTKVKVLYGEPKSIEEGLWAYSFENGEYNTFFVQVSDGKVKYIKVSLVM